MSENSAKERERLEALERELAHDPRSLAFVGLAEEHNRLGNHDDAANVAQKGLVYHPDSVAGRVALAEAESGRNNVRQALEQLKRALLIDQDNPRALALMGRILLQKGLARRAVQFLGHAVKLDPSEPEYGELLARARKSAQNEAPSMSLNQARDSASPWSEDQDESEFEVRAPDAEHTVFDPETLKKLQKRPTRVGENGQKLSIGEALQQLGSPIDDSSEAEPTRYDTKSQVLRLPGGAEDEGGEKREEPTTFDARLANAPKKKPKVGGSAAEFSQMMRSARGKNGAMGPDAPQQEMQQVAVVDAVTPEQPWPGKIEPPPVPAADDAAAPPAKSKRAAKEERGGPSKSSPAGAELPASSAESSKPVEAAKSKELKDPAEKSRKEPLPEAKEPRAVPEKEEKRPESSRAIGPAATRMVDDALWTLFGGKGDAKTAGMPEAKGSPTEPLPEAREKPAKKEPAAKEEGGRAVPAGQMVVRTSERFGTALRASIMLVAVLSLSWIGYALGVRVTGQPPEISSEEVKALAAYVDRGGLAALVAAEEQGDKLLQSLPQLEPLLNGALAEVYAQRYVHFGRDPEVKKMALERLAAVSNVAPSVEIIAAKVQLSTSAVERAELNRMLEQRIVEFPDSPKAWVLRAQIFDIDGDPEAAENALYRARAIHPQHRSTLLELARHHVRQGAYAAAFAYFDQLQAAYPEDIEAVIDRYVVGQVTGRDPNEKQTASVLQGLVREELTDVADDEVGRASLAFAVTRFTRGDIVGGLEELSKAELSYRRSGEFKATVGGVLLTVGEWERAEKSYKEALEIEPNNAEYRVGLARAALGLRSGLKLDPEVAKKTKSPTGAAAILPFGTVRFAMGRFVLVEVEPSRDLFPESAYAAAVRAQKGEALAKALESASLVALASQKLRAGQEGDALALIEEATKLHDDASVRVARGRVFVAKKELPLAIQAFKAALELDPKNIPARLGLAATLEKKNELVEAIAALEPLAKGNVVVPQAAMMLARLKTKRGDLEGAAAAMAGMREVESGDAASLCERGEAEHRMKKPGEALETFKKALKAPGKIPDPLSPVQALYVGRIELERGNDKRGLALLKQSAEAQGGPSEAHFYYGKVLIKKPKTKKAGKKELETFRRLSPSGELAQEAERLLR